MKISKGVPLQPKNKKDQNRLAVTHNINPQAKINNNNLVFIAYSEKFHVKMTTIAIVDQEPVSITLKSVLP